MFALLQHIAATVLYMAQQALLDGTLVVVVSWLLVEGKAVPTVGGLAGWGTKLQWRHRLLQHNGAQPQWDMIPAATQLLLWEQNLSLLSSPSIKSVLYPTLCEGTFEWAAPLLLHQQKLLCSLLPLSRECIALQHWEKGFQ